MFRNLRSTITLSYLWILLRFYDGRDEYNHLIFLKENNKKSWICLPALVCVGLKCGSWFNVKPHFLTLSFFLFFTDDFIHYKEYEKATFTCVSRVLILWLLLLEGDVMKLAKKSASRFYIILQSPRMTRCNLSPIMCSKTWHIKRF